MVKGGVSRNVSARNPMGNTAIQIITIVLRRQSIKVPSEIRVTACGGQLEYGMLRKALHLGLAVLDKRLSHSNTAALQSVAACVPGEDARNRIQALTPLGPRILVIASARTSRSYTLRHSGLI